MTTLVLEAAMICRRRTVTSPTTERGTHHAIRYHSITHFCPQSRWNNAGIRVIARDSCHASALLIRRMVICRCGSSIEIDVRQRRPRSVLYDIGTPGFSCTRQGAGKAALCAHAPM